MIQDAIEELINFLQIVEINIPVILYAMGALWLFNIINWLLLGSKLNRFGIIPRTGRGILGIFVSPFLHGNFNHLFFNSIPLFCLSLFITYFGIMILVKITVFIAIIAGFAVWVFARRGIHIGASGVIMGYFGFILVYGYTNPSVVSLFIALIVIYYFGSMLFSIFPSKAQESWEGHLFGCLSGIAINLLYL